jgi:hypothetical protein
MGGILRMRNNAIFIGCSFTWGQGLWSYMDTDKHVPSYEEWVFERMSLPAGAHSVRKKLHFPKLVSNELNFNLVTKNCNGGTDEDSVKFINYIFDETQTWNSSLWTDGKYKYEDIALCVYQTSQLNRNGFSFFYKDYHYYVKSTPDNRAFDFIERIDYCDDGSFLPVREKNFNTLYEFMYENNLNVEDVLNQILIKTVDGIENTLKILESNSVKIIVFCWTNEFLEEFNKRDFFKNKLIKLKYKDEEFSCLDELFFKHKHLMLRYDSNVIHNPGSDEHPSKECHEIIAQNIIEKYKNG